MSVIFFSGGNPAFLADAVTGTPRGELMLATLDRGAALAGCSAGACLFGEASPERVTDRIPAFDGSTRRSGTRGPQAQTTLSPPAA